MAWGCWHGEGGSQMKRHLFPPRHTEQGSQQQVALTFETAWFFLSGMSCASYDVPQHRWPLPTSREHLPPLPPPSWHPSMSWTVPNTCSLEGNTASMGNHRLKRRRPCISSVSVILLTYGEGVRPRQWKSVLGSAPAWVAWTWEKSVA